MNKLTKKCLTNSNICLPTRNPETSGGQRKIIGFSSEADYVSITQHFWSQGWIRTRRGIAFSNAF